MVWLSDKLRKNPEQLLLQKNRKEDLLCVCKPNCRWEKKQLEFLLMPELLEFLVLCFWVHLSGMEFLSYQIGGGKIGVCLDSEDHRNWLLLKFE